MSTVKPCLAIAFIIILAACGTATPTTSPTSVPTTQPSATPTPRDIPLFQDSFEGITDPAAVGISSNVEVILNTENFNYPGGGTALEIRGMVPGDQNSSLYIDFSVQALTGETSLDLTDKTIYYSAFIPLDSPIDNISIYAGRDGRFVFLAGITADPWWAKGVWHDYHFPLAYATDLMNDCDTIRIAGQRLSAGESMETSFLVDDLKWITSDSFGIPLDPSRDSLRKAAEGEHFEIGFFNPPYIIFGQESDPGRGTTYDPRDPWYAYMAVQEGTVSTAWNFTPMEGEQAGVFAYDLPEDTELIRQFAFADQYDLTTMGYGIGTMYQQAPQWIRDLGTQEAFQTLLLHQVEKDLSYTRGRQPIWLMFNEFLLGVTQGAGIKNRYEVNMDGAMNYSPWASSKTDASLIQAALIKAREVDPEALLFLNEYENEMLGKPRSEAFYNFIANLVSQDIPIDGVGFQMHNMIEPDGNIQLMLPFTWPIQWEHVPMAEYLAKVDLNIKRYAELGIKVAFTEIEGYISVTDLDLTNTDDRLEYERRLEWQTAYYVGLMKIALENENVILYNIWGISDRHPGAGMAFPEYSHPCLFDKNYNPKPAYKALMELLNAP